MKIEKLTENKIRVIVKPSDLDIKNLDIRSFMTKALKEQNFFTNMLKKAKEAKLNIVNFVDLYEELKLK